MMTPSAAIRRRHRRVMMMMLPLSAYLFLLLTMTSAMIYLEEFDDSLQYDAGLSPMITPDHYLTFPPITVTATDIVIATKSDAPSAMPTTTITPSINQNMMIDVSTDNMTDSPSPSPQIADDSLSPSPTVTSTIIVQDDTNSPSSTAHPSATAATSIPGNFFNRTRKTTEDESNAYHYSPSFMQESPRPTSSSTSFTSSLLSSLSSSAVSTSSSTSPASAPPSFSFNEYFYFDDLAIINDSRNYVYYDSKQARFGVDLGPRGNAVFVNIMLPPRWYSDDSLDVHVTEQNNASSVVEGEANETSGSMSNLGSDEDANLSSNNDTAVFNSRDYAWWDGNEDRAIATTTGNVFNVDNTNTTTTQGDESLQFNHSTTGQQTGSDIADYFCLEDFINWSKQNRQNMSMSSASSTLSSTTTNSSTVTFPQPNVADLIDSTRPLAILVRRGRCTFESKAQMAMVLNEIFSNSGRTNRIDHIIIYNNGTDDDNNNETGEGLVDMGYERDMEGEDDITVGLLYILSSSGEDLMRRIHYREISTFISPHLDVPMLSTEQNAHTLNRRSHLTDSESNKPDWENDTILDHYSDEGYHDKQISHGWWFPATLTRFCYSCGSDMQYGLIWDDNDVPDIPQFNDGIEMSPPHQPYGGGYHQDYYFSDWFVYIRQFLIAILVLLLVGPILAFTLRWYIVGGSFRIVTDENGARRVRIVSPNLEALVNGTRGTVERNGTKLDRAQVFSLPEIEYVEGVDEDEENSADTSVNEERDGSDPSAMHDEGSRLNSSEAAAPQATPSIGSPTRSGRFVSSSCCSICIDEFTIGERICMLPRCSHAFHTECILPWLTERQGCCPVCKVPVLPDELQRNRSVSRRVGRRSQL